MLVSFPEHYRLYEHVKKTVKDGKTEIKSKTHAGGGNDRQDAYLYGHPAGRKKRYRSPADFFPHLLWLCTDESGDPENCGCKICSPEDLDEVVPNTKVKSQGPTFKVDAGASGTATGMLRQVSGQGMTKGKQELGGPTPVLQRPLMPTILDPPRNDDQIIDRQYGGFIYRSGELVWFSRGASWGLGAVLRRWRTSTNLNQYTIQPLSHPFSHPAPVAKVTDTELRPWLAWSVPNYTNAALNSALDPPRYETMDWHALMQKKFGSGDAEVDGSILAAKAVDASYTPFASVRTIELEAGVMETYYDGIYLGAEKIWIGDPLRLAPGTDILVLHSVVVRRRSIGGQIQQQSVFLLGDTYTLQRHPHPNPSIPTLASAANNPRLPARLTADLEYRNALSIAAKGVAHYWKLVAVNNRHELNDIKGRWYETSIVLPILQPEQFEGLARKGEISEVTLWMNSRGDCVGANRGWGMPVVGRQNVYKARRREVFGQSMPAGAEIRDGIEPPSAENVDPALEAMGGNDMVGASQSSMDIDPVFDTAQNNSSDEIRVARPGEGQDQGDEVVLDDFMNLDGVEEQGSGDLPGFGQQYSQEATQQGYY